MADPGNHRGRRYFLGIGKEPTSCCGSKDKVDYMIESAKEDFLISLKTLLSESFLIDNV